MYKVIRVVVDKYHISRRTALGTILATTGVTTGVVSADVRPQSLERVREIFQTGREIRESAGREEMIRYWEARGLNLAGSSTVSRSLGAEDDVSPQKAEMADCDPTCNIIQVYGYNQLFADAKTEIIKNTTSPLGEDSGSRPYDVLSIGWEHTDYDRFGVENSDPRNPKWNGAVTGVEENTSSGIGWVIKDSFKRGVDEGEVVWSGTESCELVPEDGTDQEGRGIRASYMHNWKGSEDPQTSVSFALNGEISLNYNSDSGEAVKDWSSPVGAFANEDSR